MEYLVVLPVSKLHRGDLQVLWLPVGSALSGTVTNSTLNCIYDVTAGGEKTFTVGFARHRPFVMNWLMLPGTIQNSDYTNGRLIMRVINPLQSQDATSPVIGTVFARAKSNMQFAVPRNQAVIPIEFPTSISLNNFRYQGADGDDDNHESATVVLVQESGDYPSDQMLFGERIDSVRALLQKPSLICRRPIYTSTDLCLLPQLGPLPYQTPVGQLEPFWTYAGWYRVAFTGFATSERVKLVMSGETNADYLFAAPYVPCVDGDPPFPGYMPSVAPFTFKCAQRGGEFVIPYYTPRKYMLGRAQGNSQDAFTRDIVVFSGPAEITATTLFMPTSMWHSFGPDIRVVGFRQIPTITFPLDEFEGPTRWWSN